MEKALRESEDKFRNIFESANDCMIYLDRSGRILDVNKKAVEVFGGSKKELLGKHFTKVGIFSLRDVSKLMSVFAKGLAGKRSTLNVRIKNKKGQEIPLECSNSFARIDGKIAGMLVIARDVTERKRAEQTLRESEEKFRNLAEQSPNMIFINQKGRVVYANKKCEEVMGYKRKEFYSPDFNFFTLIAPEYMDLLKSSFSGHMKGEEVAPFEYTLITKEGKRIEAILTTKLITFKGETAILGIVTDITERKKAEDALRKSESKYRTLLENIPQKIFFKDKNSVYISCNENYARDLKIKSDEIIGKTDYDFYPKKLAEKYRVDDQRIMKSGETEDIEEEYIQNGQKMYVHTVKTPVKDENGHVVGILGIFWDITERKRSEAELIRLSSAVKMSTDSIVISDLDGMVLDVNEATLKMYGTEDKRDLIGKNAFDLIAPEEREKALAGIEEVLEKGHAKGQEYNIITKDSTKIPVEMSIAIMKDADGKPIGFVAISRDISKRKKMEEALKRQRDIAITLSGAGDLIEALNRLFDNVLEIEEFDCAGFYLVDKDTGELDMIVHRGLPDRFVEKVSHFDAGSPYTKVVMEGKPLYQKTGDFPPAIREDLQSDGILSVAAIPIHYEGEVIGHLNMASYTHDEISASTRHVLESVGAQIGETIVRARMEEKLRESEEKLRQYSERLEELVQKRTEELLESEKRYSVLVEEASDAVVILQDGRVVFANKKATEVIRYSRDELVGLPFEELVDEKYLQLVIERYMRRMRGEKVPVTYGIEVIAKTSERIPVELSATLINYEGRPADLLIMRDIRERKLMEEQRLKLEKLATLGELATMVGHDLRNPLQAITNAVYILKDSAMTMDSALASAPYEKVRSLVPEPLLTEIRQRIKNFHEEQNKTIQTIDKSIKYADKIVSGLQDFARVKEPEYIEVDLKSLIQETLSDIAIPENVKVLTRHDQHLSKLYGDPNQIRRIFTNLTTNAVQAMPNGGKLTISTSLTNSFASITFQDTGVGIPKETIKKLFTPLFTTKAQGMGMGLAICKKFVESHGGIIEVESEEGKGSTFTVKLPIQRKIGGENQ